MRVVFMGTPEFAVATLAKLIESGYEVIAVVTVPDKPAGRGLQLKQSAVKQFALQHNLPVLQPEKMKDEAFIGQLQELTADLFVVVAFRMLPEAVWAMPPKGTINLHGSLLPQYRGAAPINWALINGETKSGVTTFFIEKEIDTGNVILQDSVTITETTTAGQLHDTLMETGANLVVKTLQAIERGENPRVPQTELIKNTPVLKPAPKLNKENTRINWADDCKTIHNLIRGLSLYPTAWAELSDNKGKKLIAKIYTASYQLNNVGEAPGNIVSDGKNTLKVATANGYINILSIQVEGKKRLEIAEFLRGTHDIEAWRFA